MLNISLTIENEKAVLRGLELLPGRLDRAVKRGLRKAAGGVHREALARLSGRGKKASKAPPGGYPVPRRTGHLARSLDKLGPARSKSAGGETFRTGPMEAMVYAAAEYARVIHEGRGSSAKFGPRPYLTDALEAFNRGAGIAGAIDAEIRKEIEQDWT